MLLWAVISATSIYVRQSLLTNDSTPPVQPIPIAVPPEALSGMSFSGFRKAKDGHQIFVIFTIDEVVREQTRVIFKYSRNEGMQIARGQGIIYPENATITLSDNTRFRYTKENGRLNLRAFGLSYVLYQD